MGGTQKRDILEMQERGVPLIPVSLDVNLGGQTSRLLKARGREARG